MTNKSDLLLAEGFLENRFRRNLMFNGLLFANL